MYSYKNSITISNLLLFVLVSNVYCKINNPVDQKNGKKNVPIVDNKTKISQNDLCGSNIDVVNVKAQNMQTRSFNSNNLTSSNACFNSLTVTDQINSTNSNSNNACINNATVKNLCVTNAKINSLQYYSKFRATAAYSTNNIHNIGIPLDFDLVLDDPNHNIKLGFTGSTYTAPHSGYYIVTLQIEQNGLSIIPNQISLSLPTHNPQIVVNGQVARQSYVPYTLLEDQTVILHSLISLKEGDIVSFNYNLYMLTIAGYVPVSGVINLVGNRTENKTFFKIHYLSSQQDDLCPNCDIPSITGCIGS